MKTKNKTPNPSKAPPPKTLPDKTEDPSPPKKTPGEILYEQCAMNPLLWAMLTLNEHLRNESPPFHLKILLESMKNRFFACAAPRESAKSTILNFVKSLHGITFKKYHFIVILQSTEEKAQGSLDTIKMELKRNKKMKQYKIKVLRDTKDDTVFQHPDGFQTRVLCKGREQMGSVRGEKYGPYRPDLIIVDDLEDDKSVKNPDLREELKAIFNDAIIPAGQRGVCEYVVVGTILHYDSLMADLVNPYKYLDWRKLRYRALRKPDTSEESSLWPENWSVEELKKMRDDKPDTFAKEYQNDPSSGLTAHFDRKDFRVWRVENNQFVLLDDNGIVVAKYDPGDCVPAISCDLAWEEKKHSDSSVIMPGYLTPNSEILIDRYICEKGLRPDKIEEILFTMEERLRNRTQHYVNIGFEKAQVEKVMKHLLQKAMKRRNHFLSFKELLWDRDKITRIVTRLQPRYKQHSIFHREGMGQLETELLQIPSGAHDDLPDAAQGLVQLLRTPRSKKKSIQVDNHFEWLRKQTKQYKNSNNNKYVFGKKPVTDPLPAAESFI